MKSLTVRNRAGKYHYNRNFDVIYTSLLYIISIPIHNDRNHNNTDSIIRHLKSNQLVYPITSFSLSHPGSVSGCPGLWAMKLRSSLGLGGSSKEDSPFSLEVPFWLANVVN